LKEIKELFEQKKISEDDKYRSKEQIDKLMDDFNHKIEEIVEVKKKEIYE